MQVAEQQAKLAGFYHFDRSRPDTIKLIGKVDSSTIDKINELLEYQLVNKQTYDIKYNQIYLKGQNTPDQTESQLAELRDTYQSLKDAGYPDDYVSFQCSNVDKSHPIDLIGKQFPFDSHNTRFSILPPHSVSIFHYDHNFVTKEDGNKIYKGGFEEDYGCRKFLIALDDRTKGNAFYFGNAGWNWKKGDIVLLENAVPHYGANFSDMTRAFFMVTELLIPDTKLLLVNGIIYVNKASSGEMLSNIKSTKEDSDITILFLSEWDYGEVVVVNDEEFLTGYKRGDTRIYPGDSEINLANGGTALMHLEIITMQ